MIKCVYIPVLYRGSCCNVFIITRRYCYKRICYHSSTTGSPLCPQGFTVTVVDRNKHEMQVYNNRHTQNKRLYITFYNKPTERLYCCNNYIKPLLQALIALSIIVLLYTV